MRQAWIAPLIALAFMPSSGFAQDSQSLLTRNCELLAASPFDRTRPPDIAGIAREKVDTQAALPACQQALAADPDNLRLLFEMGRISEFLKDYDKARAFYEMAVTRGHATAHYNLGTLYMRGYGGLEKNEREAARLFKLAADQLNAAGQYGLARFYADGLGGFAKDEQEAVRFYKLAADQGYADALYGLAGFYAAGRGGLAKDDREAARLYKLAADQGDALGQAVLGTYYETGRGGFQKSEEEAVRLYRLAADQGNASGQFNLGTMYLAGRGVTRDYTQATSLFQRAADQGHEGAKAWLLENQSTIKSPQDPSKKRSTTDTKVRKRN
jgi:TPR repeat protein